MSAEGKDRTGTTLAVVVLVLARNYVVKPYNVLRSPLPGPGERWYPSHFYRVTLILLSLVGMAWDRVVSPSSRP